MESKKHECAVGYTRNLSPSRRKKSCAAPDYKDIYVYYFLQFNIIVFEGNATERQL